MNKEETKEAVDIMSAWCSGVSVASRRKGSEEDWIQYPEYCWDFHMYEYRIYEDQKHKAYDKPCQFEVNAIVIDHDECQWRIGGHTVMADLSLAGVVLMKNERGSKEARFMDPDSFLKNYCYLSGESCGLKNDE